MKRSMKFSMLVLIAMTFAMGCTTDTANPNPNQPSVNPPSDSWRVTWYWDKDKDETSDFAQYTFYFRSSGVFEAINNGNIVTGTWATTSDEGSQRLVLFLSNTKPLSNANDDWVIVTSDEQSIKLKDDNTTHLEELHFERMQ